jgi:DNA-binding protein YbaB
MMKGQIAGLMKQAQQMQENMKKMQEQLAQIDAVRKAEATTQEKMGSVTSGLGGMAGMLPPGFKLPF